MAPAAEQCFVAGQNLIAFVEDSVCLYHRIKRQVCIGIGCRIHGNVRMRLLCRPMQKLAVVPEEFAGGTVEAVGELSAERFKAAVGIFKEFCAQVNFVVPCIRGQRIFHFRKNLLHIGVAEQFQVVGIGVFARIRELVGHLIGDAVIPYSQIRGDCRPVCKKFVEVGIIFQRDGACRIAQGIAEDDQYILFRADIGRGLFRILVNQTGYLNVRLLLCDCRGDFIDEVQQGAGLRIAVFCGEFFAFRTLTIPLIVILRNVVNFRRRHSRRRSTLSALSDEHAETFENFLPQFPVAQAELCAVGAGPACVFPFPVSQREPFRMCFEIRGGRNIHCESMNRIRRSEKPVSAILRGYMLVSVMG